MTLMPDLKFANLADKYPRTNLLGAVQATDSEFDFDKMNSSDPVADPMDSGVSIYTMHESNYGMEA
jgi:hypothetical protein